MKIVCARLGHRVDCARGVLSILGRQRAGFHLEFLQRVGEGQRQIQVVEWIVMRAPVQQIGQAIVQPARHGNGLRRIIPVRGLGASADSRS